MFEFMLVLLPAIILFNLDIDSFFGELVLFLVLIAVEVVIILWVMSLHNDYISNKISKKKSLINQLNDEKTKIKEDIYNLKRVETQISDSYDFSLLRLFELCMSRQEYERCLGKATVNCEQRINYAIKRIRFNNSSISRNINKKDDIKLKICSLNNKLKEIDSKITVLSLEILSLERKK